MSTQSGFDISTTPNTADAEDEGTIVHVTNAAGKLLYVGEDKETRKPVTITVAGTYSKIYRRATDAQRERNIRLRRSSLTGEALAKQQLETTAACILGWDGFVNAGSPFPFNRDNAVKLLDSAPWIREQVEEAMNDHASFFSRSPKT